MVGSLLLSAAPALAEVEIKFGHHLPPSISTYGHDVDHGFYLMHWVMLFVALVWGGVWAYSLVRFRAANGGRASRGVTIRASLVTAFGMLVFELADLFLVSAPTWAKITQKLPPASQSVVVEIVGEQFQWNVRYPGPDGLFGRTDPALVDSENRIGLDRADPAGRDDVVPGAGDLHIPVATPVIVMIRSQDVIHSFFIPVMRVKRDVVPGLDGRVWMQATQTGRFETGIGCAQLCGLGHSRMAGNFTVDTPEDFRAFLAENAPEEEEAQ